MDFRKIGTGLKGVIFFRNVLSVRAFAVYWPLIALKDKQRFDTHLSCHVALHIYSVTNGVILCCQISVRIQSTWMSHVIIELYKKNLCYVLRMRVFGPIIIIGILIQKRYTVMSETKRHDQCSGSSNCRVYSTDPVWFSAWIRMLLIEVLNFSPHFPAEFHSNTCT